VETAAAVRTPALAVASEQATRFGVAFPTQPRQMVVPFPILSLEARTAAEFWVDVEVRTREGETVVVTYGAFDGLPAGGARRAFFPLGSELQDGLPRLVARDVAADVAVAFGLTFGNVGRVRVWGSVTLGRLRLAARGYEPALEPLPDELPLPLTGWKARGRGTVMAGVLDPELGAVTLQAVPVDPMAPRLTVTSPRGKRGKPIAPYGAVRFVVRDDVGFAVEVTVQTTLGRKVRLRYAADVREPVLEGRRSVWPMRAEPVEGSAYRVVTLDVAGAVAQLVPGAGVHSVQQLRLHGQFTLGALVLTEPTD
jgi:hypothetical protein